MNRTPDLKRPLLYLLVTSVILGVILGIAIVARNTWGWFEFRVIFTTLTIAVASICGLACDVSRTLRGFNLVPRVGLVLCLLAASLMLVGIWFEPNSHVYSETFWKSTMCVTVFAIATAHVCLLSIARVARRFRWVQSIGYQAIFGLALLIAVMIVWETSNQRMIQLLAAMSILVAGLTLLIPLLHRISKTDPSTPPPLSLFGEKNVAAIDGEILQLRKRIAELEKLREQFVRGV